MKYTPEDNILSKRAKKNKKDADLKSYFDNTHPIFTPSWIKYKNPSLHQEEEEEESETKQPKGMALLEKIYGGRDPCWKGYEQFGMKEKNGRQVPNCVPIANNKLKAKGREVNTYNKVVENWASNYPNEMTKDIKRVNELHLTPAMKVGTGDNLYKVSNPREVQKKAFDIYGKDAIIYKSNKPNKKYQILDKLTGKFVHFGDAKMEDFEKHLDPVRQRNYLNRSLNIKGKWRENPYSPNTLAIMLLW